MARQFVYFMQGLTKAYPTRKVLDNVHLSFYPDAKIGVLGANGAGKSTLLRIMAGIDKDFAGEAWPAEGATRRLPAAGAAARSDARTCCGNVDGGRRREEGASSTATSDDSAAN
ncbi:MAG: ATP-binding cassette domain-containing protein [Rhodopseudomonas palustris]|nr:ATP-binding cassette domain-containing protein [Rhodopseudomonas palustris]